MYSLIFYYYVGNMARWKKIYGLDFYLKCVCLQISDFYSLSDIILSEEGETALNLEPLACLSLCRYLFYEWWSFYYK